MGSPFFAKDAIIWEGIGERARDEDLDLLIRRSDEIEMPFGFDRHGAELVEMRQGQIASLAGNGFDGTSTFLGYGLGHSDTYLL